MQYEIVIERSPTGFGAYVPDLPGCVAIAESEAEVRELIRAAIEFHLEALRDADWEVQDAAANPEQSRASRDATITAQLNRVYRDDPGGLDPALRRIQHRSLETSA